MIEFKRSWDTHLSLMEFAYNNSYQSSMGMAPFEALYGQQCRTPIQITSDKIHIVRDRLKTTKDKQKSYTNKHRRDLQFKVGDNVFFKFSP